MKAPTRLRSPLSPYNLRNGQVPICLVLSTGCLPVQEGDRPGLLIPGWITSHDLKIIEQNVDLGIYESVAV